MTSRYSLVIRAYPDDYRRAHSGELVQTANELTSGWSFRQSRSLLVEGLRTRTRLSTNGLPEQAWASGLALALGLAYLIRVVMPSTYLLGGTGDVVSVSPSPWISLAQTLPAFVALTLSTRWPTAVIVTASNASMLFYAAQADGAFGVFPIVATMLYLLTTTALFVWLAVQTEGPRAFSPTVGLALLVVSVTVSVALNSPDAGLVFTAAHLGPLIVGVLLTTIDPRPLIAGTVLILLTLSQIILHFLFVPGATTSELAIPTMIALAILGVAGTLSRFSTRRALAV